MPAVRPPIAGEIRATIGVAAPLAAANLAQMAMQVTNAVMVGHLGAVPLAAAGLGNALNSILLMTSMGLLTAVALAPPMMATLLLLPPLLGGLGYEAGLVAEIRSFLWAICWGVPGHRRSTGAAGHDRARSDYRLRERRLMSGGYARRPPADRW